jgi:uncharacterized caspase-like protein
MCILRVLVILALGVGLVAQLTATAQAEVRVALVIGNGAYQNVTHLTNPTNDAKLIADTLQQDGFRVTLVDDVDRDGLAKALRTFGHQANNADWAVIYYAGHGIEMGGMNYLVPVDAKLETDQDVGLEALPLDQVLKAVEGAHALKLVILDACRNNPFASLGRSVGRGLARVGAPSTLVAYSAGEGAIALDGDGADSPYAVALAKRLAEPGVEISKMFRLVRDDVQDATGKNQDPFTYGDLPGQDFYFRLTSPTENVAAPAAGESTTFADYQATAAVGTAAAWNLFLKKHGSEDNLYVGLAKENLIKLTAKSAEPPAAPEAHVVPVEPKTEPAKLGPPVPPAPAAAETQTAKLEPVAPAAATSRSAEPISISLSGIPLYAVFSPDGSRLATAKKGDGTAEIWDTAAGGLLTTLKDGDGGEISSIAFSPDGRRILTAQHRTAKLWDVSSGRRLTVLTGHSDTVMSAAFSPDGSRVLTASLDNTAKQWDAASGRLLMTLQGHTHELLFAAYSPDGGRIVTTSADKTAKLWDAASGQLLTTLIEHPSFVLGAAFSPDGKQVATWGPPDAFIVWDVASGRLLTELPLLRYNGSRGAAPFFE